MNSFQALLLIKAVVDETIEQVEGGLEIKIAAQLAATKMFQRLKEIIEREGKSEIFTII